MQQLEVNVTYTEPITTIIERYVPPDEYIRKGDRKRKVQECYTLGQHEQAKETQRCSIANSKRTFKGIIHANYRHYFSILTLTFSPRCDFDTKYFITCRDRFNSFWTNLKWLKKLASLDLRNIGAIEFQQNSRIHFHILCRIPKEVKKLLQSKWKHGGLHYTEEHGIAEDKLKIGFYLNKGIYDERMPKGKKRYLGGTGLERPVLLKFNSRKIIDFLLQRNGNILNSFPSPYGFTVSLLITDATVNELESFAEAANEDLHVTYLEKLESIQYT